MTRVAILVEAGFLDHHVGVRNYLLSAHAHLRAAGADVQFVSVFRPFSHAANWYRLQLRDPRFARDNGILTDWAIKAPAAEVMAQFAAGPPPGGEGRPDVWYTQIGTRLEAGGYDTLVVGYPWAVDFDDRPPVRRVVGLVYDAIPTRFCLTGPAKPFHFAAQHARGFRFYREQCDETLTISPAVADDLVELFHFPADKVRALPSMIPPACLALTVTAARRPGAVLLASPLDRRKGLAAMPDLVRASGATTLLMYGGVRCPPEDVPAFFAALPPDLPVEWHPRATAATTERLFREAELLLFPSESEGLGLPLIEAQLRGCPAVARPKRPMSDLLVPGHSRTLPGDPDGDRAVVRELLADEGFDHDGLAAAAGRFYDVDTLPARVAAAVVGDV